MRRSRRAARAAPRLGRLVAHGLLDRQACLDALTRTAAGLCPLRDAGGMRARLAHALDDAAAREWMAWQAARTACSRAAWAALRAGLCGRQVLQAARDAGAGLAPREAEALAAGALRAALAGAHGAGAHGAGGRRRRHHG